MRGLLPALVLAPVATAVITLGVFGAHPHAGQVLGAKPVPQPPIESQVLVRTDPDVLFKTSGDCTPCHNSLITPSGEDVSMGSNWRASVMANSARDPYWQAAVRRETIDHPTAAAEIQDECSKCHMPMARATANVAGRKGEVFSHLPVADHDEPLDRLAHDGVSCTMCHQITSEKLGTPESYVGGFLLTPKQPAPRPIFGPFKIDPGMTTIMRSSAEFQPMESAHIRQSEVCATCHTLITQALNPQGQVIGRLPEQMMYQEWKHSAFVTEQKSCQSCHMPVVQEDTPIASTLGAPRPGLARHVFVGGNFFLLRILNRYRNDLGVVALPPELDASVRRTIQNLQTATATIAVQRAEIADGRLNIDLSVQNLTGHKLPTGYPARRAWLHVTVRDANGRPVFESGTIAPSGEIQGNDNDADGSTFEPHYTEIRQPDQVQIYESIMGDPSGRPTTGLLTAVRYLKDNRLVPRGFDKVTAEPDVAVVGPALQDVDFTAASDHVRYSVAVAGAGPFQVDAELRFQPIAYRWAQNLKPYNAPEPRRFVGYYEAMSSVSSEVLSHISTTAP